MHRADEVNGRRGWNGSRHCSTPGGAALAVGMGHARRQRSQPRARPVRSLANPRESRLRDQPAELRRRCPRPAPPSAGRCRNSRFGNYPAVRRLRASAAETTPEALQANDRHPDRPTSYRGQKKPFLLQRKCSCQALSISFRCRLTCTASSASCHRLKPALWTRRVLLQKSVKLRLPRADLRTRPRPALANELRRAGPQNLPDRRTRRAQIPVAPPLDRTALAEMGPGRLHRFEKLRQRRMRSFFLRELVAPGCAFSPAWIPSFEFPARSLSRLLFGTPRVVQSGASGRPERAAAYPSGWTRCQTALPVVTLHHIQLPLFSCPDKQIQSLVRECGAESTLVAFGINI